MRKSWHTPFDYLSSHVFPIRTVERRRQILFGCDLKVGGHIQSVARYLLERSSRGQRSRPPTTPCRHYRRGREARTPRPDPAPHAVGDDVEIAGVKQHRRLRGRHVERRDVLPDSGDALPGARLVALHLLIISDMGDGGGAHPVGGNPTSNFGFSGQC